MVNMFRRLIITTCYLSVLVTPLPIFAETGDSVPWHKRFFSKSTSTSYNQINDLWAHIQGNLDIDTNASNPYVKNQYKWYSQNTDYLTRTLNRAQPYLYNFVSELAARELPLALALIPIVESDYNPYAHSSQGAVGLWQLMPATARHLGVQRNSYYDGRRDLYDSTRAAIDYLSYLNRFFDGDWLLVLAAYNSGEGTVQNAIRKNERLGKKTDFWSLDLPRETKLYVPKILALAQVISDPDRLDLELPFIPHAPMYDWVEVQQPLDLKLAANMADMSWSDFKLMNSGFGQSSSLPQGNHRLFLPIENATAFKASMENMESLASKDYTEDYKSLNIPSLSYASKESNYKVKSGDSLWKIAQINKVSIADLRKWNDLSARGDLKPGQTLKIVKTLPKTSLASSHSEQLRKLTYRVRSGDSFSKIASQFKVSQEDLKAWNKLSTKHMLQPGQNLIVYVDQKNSA
jgi:membrane-bound lytic murein transglycosylase D